MVSDTLVDLVKRFEGCRLTPYFCSAGVLTIGYGATGVGVYPNESWTQEQAEERLKRDLERFSEGVLYLCPNLENNRLNAVISFAFNCGLGNLKASTLRKKCNAGDYAGAQREFGKWINAAGKPVKGLVRRRAAEAALFNA
jgi:lysozyme